MSAAERVVFCRSNFQLDLKRKDNHIVIFLTNNELFKAISIT